MKTILSYHTYDYGILYQDTKYLSDLHLMLLHYRPISNYALPQQYLSAHLIHSAILFNILTCNVHIFFHLKHCICDLFLGLEVLSILLEEFELLFPLLLLKLWCPPLPLPQPRPLPPY